MSANLIVDIGATAQYAVSAATQGSPASGIVVGEIIDMLHSDTYCNVFATGGGNSGGVHSGFVAVAVQTSDGLTSGSFTDPTSGLPAGALPSFVASGGIFYFNSGLATSGALPLGAPVNNASPFCSGGVGFGAFLRQARYARLVILSGQSLVSPVTAGIVSNLKTVGSGAGFSYSPTSGTINV